MGTCVTWSESLSEKVVRVLCQGRDSATQLRSALLREPGSVQPEELAEKILASFDGAISFFSGDRNRHSGGGAIFSAGREADNPEALDHHSHCDDRSSEDSGESSKKRSPAVGFKDRRGCYKRRKNSQSWTTVMSTIEDGQAWRKYGQKEILNAKYPRAYFRCTRKHEQGCRATKQVQQIQDNPKKYQTTYIGQHTCKNILKAPQMIVDNSEPNYNFDSNSVDFNTNVVPTDKYSSKSKQEQEQEEQERVLIKEEGQISQDLWSDLKDFDSMGLLSPNSEMTRNDKNEQEAVDSIGFSFLDRISMDNMVDNNYLVKSIDFCAFDEAEFSLLSA